MLKDIGPDLPDKGLAVLREPYIRFLLNGTAASLRLHASVGMKAIFTAIYLINIQSYCLSDCEATASSQSDIPLFEAIITHFAKVSITFTYLFKS